MSEYIFSKHALQRLKERSIPLDQAELVLRHPDQTFPGKKANSIKFAKNINGRNMQLVGTYLPDQKKWLVVSAWVRGEEDRVPFVWQIITLPFKFIWWLFKRLIAIVAKSARNT